MTDANGWPDEVREAVARAMRQAQYQGRILPDFDSWQKAYWFNQADAALAALAPYRAAMLAALVSSEKVAPAGYHINAAWRFEA